VTIFILTLYREWLNLMLGRKRQGNVSEGSTLGAAFLFKEAQNRLGLTAEHGARNLAAYPEGRAKVWKRFVQALNDAELSQQEQDQVVQGALDAFNHFGELLIQLDELK